MSTVAGTRRESCHLPDLSDACGRIRRADSYARKSQASGNHNQRVCCEEWANPAASGEGRRLVIEWPANL
jgi:hypothetical protein